MKEILNFLDNELKFECSRNIDNLSLDIISYNYDYDYDWFTVSFNIGLFDIYTFIFYSKSTYVNVFCDIDSNNLYESFNYKDYKIFLTKYKEKVKNIKYTKDNDNYITFYNYKNKIE